MHRKSMIRNKYLQSGLFYFLLLAAWQLLYVFGTGILELWKPYAFPGPVKVLESLVIMAGSGGLFTAVISSIRRCLLGFAISLLVGIAAGMMMSKVPFIRRNIKPLFLGIQTLPSICWVPFAILWFGLKESAILFVVVMGSVFSVSLAVEDAIRQVPVLYIKVARTMGVNGRNLFFHVLFPAALPAFVSGMKQSWSFAWRALMSGEVMSSYVGLGFALMTGRDMADINQVMAVMLVIVILGIAIEKQIFGRIERRLLSKRGL